MDTEINGLAGAEQPEPAGYKSRLIVRSSSVMLSVALTSRLESESVTQARIESPQYWVLVGCTGQKATSTYGKSLIPRGVLKPVWSAANTDMLLHKARLKNEAWIVCVSDKK